MKHGAIHRPDHPAANHARAFIDVAAPVDHIELVALPNWFTKWNWPATGNILGNDDLGDCVEAADIVLCQGFANSLGLAPITGANATQAAETRYEAIAGWNGVVPGNDPGTITQVDAFAWQTVPIVTDAQVWRVGWYSVEIEHINQALGRWPLLLTLGLCADDEDDPDTWQNKPSGPYVARHRVVCGAIEGNWFTCRTYGFDVPVSPDRIVGADMMLLVNAPADIQTAGIDWKNVGSPIPVV
jgi:hypothetical protein